MVILIVLCWAFQELECAVSVEDDNRQEWTFTLYDFDNNGKVTREVNFTLKSKMMIKNKSRQRSIRQIKIKIAVVSFTMNICFKI